MENEVTEFRSTLTTFLINILFQICLECMLGIKITTVLIMTTTYWPSFFFYGHHFYTLPYLTLKII